MGTVNSLVPVIFISISIGMLLRVALVGNNCN